MATRIELPNRDVLVCVLDDSPAIMVHVKIIGCTKDGDDGGELFSRSFAVHHVSRTEMRCERNKGNDMGHTLHPEPRALAQSQGGHSAQGICTLLHTFHILPTHCLCRQPTGRMRHSRIKERTTPCCIVLKRRARGQRMAMCRGLLLVSEIHDGV